MLLYHFPLNTQENIVGFVNKGMKSNFALLNNNIVQVADNGIVSNKCVNPNGDKLSIDLSLFDEFSFCFRFYADSNLIGGTSFRTIVGLNTNTTQNNPTCSLFTTANSANYSFSGSSYNGTFDNKWHSIVITKKSTTIKVYVNSTLITTGTFSDSARYICLWGRYSTNSYNIDTLTQDIRIYDYALSQAEINEYSRALVVHYPLQGNELNPSVLKDVSGLGNDYTLQGTNSYQLDSARGLKSLHTTDTSIYTQTPISSGYTTSFWCKYNGEWKHLCNNGSKYVDGVVNASQYDTIYATLTAYGYDIVDYRVYATALSAEDIKNLYNSPISVSKQHQTMAFEFKENPLYPSKYWHTPTYNEMYYILNTRTNASNLRTFGRVDVNGTYVNGCFLLPDDWILPDGVTMTITIANYITNTYSLSDLETLEDNGAVFLVGIPIYRTGSTIAESYRCGYSVGTGINEINRYCFYFSANNIEFATSGLYVGRFVRLCRSSQDSHSFSASPSTQIKFAKSNLQYHCTQHIWRFAEHSYDYIGAANANISDNYNGWIDLFGYGTSGVNYSPTLHTTNNAGYASGDIANTDNDWGVNEIQSYDYNAKNFALNKNGIVQHDELRENDSEVNGCYNDKLITNELIEN